MQLRHAFQTLTALPLAVAAMCSAAQTPFALAGRATTQTPLPQVAHAAVDYASQIKPLLTAHCYACHGNGMKLSGLSLETRGAILKGGQSGPAVVPGASGKSLLIRLVSGGDPARVMPARGKRLTAAEIGTLRAWIDAGLPFDAAGMRTGWTAPLLPRTPRLPPAPPGSGISNPVDRLLLPYFASHHMEPPPLVDDRTYARRAYLDVIGLLPSPSELAAFLADHRVDRRQRLVRALLAQDDRYAAQWITFWNDMLRNDYTGTGYIDGGRRQITAWLYAALRDDMPYDRFVASLLAPTPDCAGFIDGIVWRGVVNASQTPQMQAAQNISQVFLGVNLKCASCHNSFVSAWKLSDAYGMAGIYADGPLEMVRCDRPTGQIAPVKFIYPELGRVDASAPRADRMRQLAAILTCRQDGRLARTLVNRLWTRLMGRGLVEPNDDMDAQPWNPNLLDWLASDLAHSGYDVKRTLYVIATSRAYQMRSVGLPSEQSDSDFVFRGPAVKRLTAEQLVDAVSTLTGVWQSPAEPVTIERGEPRFGPGCTATVRFASGVLRSGSVQLDVDVTGASTLALVVTDAGDGNAFDWADWVNPEVSGPAGRLRLTGYAWRTATAGYGQVNVDKNVVGKPLEIGGVTYADGIGTHANSVITYALPPGMSRFRAIAGPDSGGVTASKGKTSIRIFVVTGDRSLFEQRAALAVADPLMRALGRPNRDQVVTERSSAATTLQALELTNGPTLNAMLESGAVAWRTDGLSSRKLVHAIFSTALCRPPTPTEQKAGVGLVGSPPTDDGIQDLLWAVVMLPDFQLIY